MGIKEKPLFLDELIKDYKKNFVDLNKKRNFIQVKIDKKKIEEEVLGIPIPKELIEEREYVDNEIKEIKEKFNAVVSYYELNEKLIDLEDNIKILK